MKNVKLKLAVFGVFGALSVQAQAAGFTALPDTGFASSAYMSCYNTGRVVPYGGVANNTRGNFGSFPIALANYPVAGTNDACWVAKPASEATLPAGKTGFTQLTPQSNPIPTTTGGVGSIGTLVDRAWRKPAATAPVTATDMCIIGTRATMFSADHDSGIGGTQLFEINDIARGGFSASGTVNVAYAIFASPVTTASPLFRVGRTKSSVQHRSLKYDTLANKAVNGTNYLDLPTKTTFTGAINGEVAGIASTATASTTAATQDAAVDANYVDFTFDTVFNDDDGSHAAHSAFVYIESTCNGDPTIQANAIRLRQTGQENTTQKEIMMPGYAIGTP